MITVGRHPKPFTREATRKSSADWHEKPSLPPMPTGRFAFRKETFAGDHGSAAMRRSCCNKNWCRCNFHIPDAATVPFLHWRL
jgi:hypothetical protein